MPFPEFPDPLKPRRTGTQFAFAEVDGAADESGYSEEPGDHQKLLWDIERALYEKKYIEDFYYRDYATTKITRFQYSQPSLPKEVRSIDYAKVIHENRIETLYFDLRMNRRVGRSLDPTPRYRIRIDTSVDFASYHVDFLFAEGTPQLLGDEAFELKLLDAQFEVAGVAGKRILGASFYSQDMDQYVLMNEKLNNYFKDLEGYVHKKFSSAYESLDRNDYERVSNFYAQAPIVFLSSLATANLIQDAGAVLMYDKATWLLDNSNVMIKTLGVIMGKDGGTAAMYDGFNTHPEYIKEIYYNLDESNRSMLYGGMEVPHKTVFATMLALICNDQPRESNPDRWKTHIVFKIAEGYRVSSKILFDDEYPDRYDLYQEYESPVTAPPTLPGTSLPSSIWLPQATYQLHPLDMVTLEVEGPNGILQRMIVPAIMVKDMAYHRQWGEVMQTIRLSVDIFIIAISIATLVSGPSSLMFAVSVIDLGLATTDIVVQSFASEIAKLDGGKEFLDLWETVYLVGGIATGLASLGPLLRSGAKLLVKVVSVETRNQLLAMLKYALRGVKGLPRFVKGQFEIVVDFVNELGRFAGQMQELARHGAMLVKGVVEGDTLPTYYLMFRNAILESGSLEEMGVALKRIVEEGKADLAGFLGRLFWMKSGTGGGYKYITEATSTRIFCQEQPMSCTAACIRQLVKDHLGNTIDEAIIRIEAGTDGSGTGFHNYKPTLRKLLPNAIIDGAALGSAGTKDWGKLAEDVFLQTKHPWIANFKRFREPLHTIIVDKIVDGIVYLRDPWDISRGYGADFGVEATMKLEDFAEVWTGHAVYIITI